MGKRAPLPSAAYFEQRRKNRQENRADPPPPREESQVPGVMKTYRVLGNRICHGKRKGDLVELWDTGATRALVKAGHLVEAAEDKDQADSAD